MSAVFREQASEQSDPQVIPARELVTLPRPLFDTVSTGFVTVNGSALDTVLTFATVICAVPACAISAVLLLRVVLERCDALTRYLKRPTQSDRLGKVIGLHFVVFPKPLHVVCDPIRQWRARRKACGDPKILYVG